jgi:hypothetical protein
MIVIYATKLYYQPHSHSLEQSPCYPIISVKPAGKQTILYYCEICRPEFANDPAVANIALSAIEHHCLYRDPKKHKAEILARISVQSKSLLLNSSSCSPS